MRNKTWFMLTVALLLVFSMVWPDSIAVAQTSPSSVQWSPAGTDPNSNWVQCLLDINNVLYEGADNGVRVWSGTAWTPVGASSWPQAHGSADAAYSLADIDGTVYAGTGSSGVYALSGGAWTQVGTAWPSQDEACSLADIGGTVYAGTGSSGVYALSGGAWTQVGASSWPQAWGSPATVSSLADVGGTLYAGTGSSGVYALSGGAWTQVGAVPFPGAGFACHLACAGGILYCGGADYVFAWNGGAWTQTGNYNGLPDNYDSTLGGPTLEDVNGTVFAGTGYGVWSLDNGAWTQVGASSWPQANGYADEACSLADVGGTVYAGTASSGVYALEGGAWTKAGTWQSPDAAWCLACVDGTVYAGTYNLNQSTPEGDGMWSLDDGTWTQAGSGLGGNWVTSVVYDEGDGTVYAGTWGGEGVCALDGGVWMPLSGSSGTNPELVNSLADVGGAVYAGTGDYKGVLAWNGANWTQVGASSWPQANGYADEACSLADVGGTLYAGAGSSGVYALSGGAWTPVGSLEGTSSICISPETNGALYAGTGDGVWAYVGPPEASTGAATAVTADSVVLSGRISANTLGFTTSYGFYYGTSPGNLTSEIPACNSDNTGAFSATASGLSPGTTYYYEAFARNNAGTGYGSVSSFTTQSSSVATGGGGGGKSVTPSAVTSTSGSASVYPTAGGTVSLGTETTVSIPANALQGTAAVNVTIQSESSPPASPSGYTVVGAYDFTVNGQDHYTFNSPVTLTFTFDPSKVPQGTTPAVYYYDGTQWVLLNGTVDWAGDTITVTVDHFTLYAVMVEAQTPKTPATLKDIAGNWAQADIEKLVSLGAITGYPDGTFRPDNDITRAEFVTVLVKALKLTPKAGPVFADTRGTWAQGYVSTAAAYGIVSGYDPSHFGPNDPITREQMTAMVVRAAKLTPVTGTLSFKDAATIDAWAKGDVITAVKDGIVNGYPDGTFRPLAYTTRAEAVTVMAGLLK